MKKIPLEPAIVGSYKFLFRNIVSIIGTLWFPVVVLAALIGGLVYAVVPQAWWHGAFKCADVPSVILGHLPLIISGALLIMVAAFAVRAMITVGLLRHSLGEKTSTTFIYFSLGARVWRMVAIVLIAMIVYIVMEIVAATLFVGVNVGMTLVPHLPSAVVTLINLVVGLAIVLGFIYLLLRLFFFLPAVVVAENRIGLGRSWQLGKGNVLRMIVILIAVTVPVSLIAGLLFYMTLIPTIVVEAIRQHPAGPEQALAFLKSLWPLLPALAGIELVASIALAGLVAGALGISYKAVTAPEENNQ